MFQTTLDILAIGQSARIVRIAGDRQTRRRLLDLGLVTGETISVHRIAPLGDPLDLLIKGYHLSLRKQDAHEITVEVGHDA